jgi:PleD family two-component response regulator
LIFKAQIPHDASPAGQLLTISLGVGTTIPARHEAAIDFVEMVDQRLYQAKQRGRNCIVGAL